MSPSPRPARGLCAACVHAFLHERDCIMIFISPATTQHSSLRHPLLLVQGSVKVPVWPGLFSIFMESGSVQLCNPLLDSQTLSTLYRADPLRSLSTLSSLLKPYLNLVTSHLRRCAKKLDGYIYFIFYQFCMQMRNLNLSCDLDLYTNTYLEAAWYQFYSYAQCLCLQLQIPVRVS